MIQVKNADVLISLGVHWHRHLKALIHDVAEISGIYITEGSREKTWRGDLHGTAVLRAIDGGDDIYTSPEAFCDLINKRWIYDPKRPEMKCALYHARCPKCGEDHHYTFIRICAKCGKIIEHYWHIHFQVHGNTERRDA